MKKAFIIFCLILISAISRGQTITVQELNVKLSRGINMGNMFEAPSETAWGNPFKDDYFTRIASLGFKHVRIPIRWDVAERANLNHPYTLNPVFLARIKYVVDKANEAGLLAIINMHHHEELFQNPDLIKPRFLSQWGQIATYFKGNDTRLLFEILNEPNANLTPDKWNVFFQEALTEIRKTNATRAVLIGPANYNSLRALPNLKWPKDPNLILTIHYYNPFHFTHQGAEWIGTEAQGWLGTPWKDLEIERNQVVSEFDYLLSWSKKYNIPVYIGEFGSYSKADLDSRVRWTTYLSRWFESQGFSWAYWEFSAGFGIFDPIKGTYNMPLVDALLKNPMPKPLILPVKSVYKSDFSTSLDGWILNLQSGGGGLLAKENSKLNVQIKQVTGTNWHVQMVKPALPIYYKKQYYVKFKASADTNVIISVYVAKNASPYNAYSDYYSCSVSKIEKDYSFAFTMNSPTDLIARLTLDIGAQVANIQFNSFVIEEVISETILATNLVTKEEPKFDFVVFPNPSRGGELNVDLPLMAEESTLEITNVLGEIVYSKGIKEESEKMVLAPLAKGVYFFSLRGEKKNLAVKKIIIE